MMFRLVHRLKKKHGAVLFAVLAVMALLIAMATAAYYTARSSYNTVVSNYDYSQLYISAISAADMVKGAVMNSASTTGSEAKLDDGTSMNFFDDLQKGIKKLKVGQSIYLKSANIKDVTEDRTKIAQYLSELDAESSGSNTIAEDKKVLIPGALDGIMMEVKLLKEEPTKEAPKLVTPAPVEGKDTYETPYNHVYEIITTAFYRGGSVQVDDIINARVWKLYDVTPGTDTYLIPVEKSSTEIEVIEIKKPGGGGNMFNTFFTATAQHVNTTTGAVEEYQERCVVIDCKTITDDSYFKSDKVFVENKLGNVIEGGITTSGSLYLKELKFRDASGNESESADAAANSTLAKNGDNDWFIGNNLVLGGNAQNLNLGTGDKASSLYVGGDLVIARSGVNITAKDIYVGGNLVILDGSTTTLNSNVHLIGDPSAGKGNITFGKNTTNAFNATTAENDKSAEFGSSFNEYSGKGGNVKINTLYTKGKVVGVSGGSITLNGENVNVGDSFITDSHSAPNAVHISKDPDKVTYKTTINKDDQFQRDWALKDDKGKAVEVTGSTAMANNQLALKQTTYGTITSKQETYDNVLTVDIAQAVQKKDSNNNVKGYEAEFYVNNDTTKPKATFVTNSDCKDVTLKLPYVEEGYVLDLKNVMEGWYELSPGVWGGGHVNSNANFKIEIETKDGKAMPIVLATNSKDSKGKPTFTWCADGTTDYNSLITDVKLMPETTGGADYGNVIFEMANSLEDSDKPYEPYDPSKSGSFTVTKYQHILNAMMGTKAQVELIRQGDNGALDDDEKEVMFSSGSYPKAGYEDHIMLVSNANDDMTPGVAFKRQNGAMFGYIYAPNAYLDASLTDDWGNQQGDAESIIGGIIVSSYTSMNNYFTFVQPRPSDIQNMIGAMTGSGAGGGGGGTTEQIENEIKKAWKEYEEKGKKSDKKVSDYRDSDKDSVWVEVGSNYIG